MIVATGRFDSRKFGASSAWNPLLGFEGRLRKHSSVPCPFPECLVFCSRASGEYRTYDPRQYTTIAARKLFASHFDSYPPVLVRPDRRCGLAVPPSLKQTFHANSDNWSKCLLGSYSLRTGRETQAFRRPSRDADIRDSNRCGQAGLQHRPD